MPYLPGGHCETTVIIIIMIGNLHHQSNIAFAEGVQGVDTTNYHVAKIHDLLG
jgi:hypothetical protein